MPAKRARSATIASDTTQKGGPGKEVASANDKLCAVFEDLMYYESKDGNKWAGVAYNKVLKALRALKKPIASGSDLKNVGGVGKASIEKVDEFLSSGKIQKLDELRELHGPLPAMLKSAKSGNAKGKEERGKPLTKAQAQSVRKAAEKFTSLSLDSLKALLKSNRQVVSGAKTELVQRCAEGSVLGALPSCPLCSGGKLRFNSKTGIYLCPGYMDDDVFKPCYYNSTTVTRNQWQ